MILSSPPRKRGSSPRVWGIRCITCRLSNRGRFIPTCVGNTHCRSQRRRGFAVHPHVCGEYAKLPPLVSPEPTVHPHVCGEYEFWRRRNVFAVGSSPRVWGIRETAENSIRSTRFIPTCVGNTRRVQRLEAFIYGSSPRVWGIRATCSRNHECARFIPTCVGNTAVFASIASSVAVHPHVCGEYVVSAGKSSSSLSVHPHVCGEYLISLANMRRLSVHPHVCGEYSSATSLISAAERFIPTCVGNTDGGQELGRRRTVHPHVCGEYSDVAQNARR